MSILIKGMEMPKSCEKCKIEREILEDDVLFGDYDGFCPIANEYTDEVRNSGRLHRCPLGDVPTPHGDLIDKGAAVETAMEWCPDDDGSVGKIGDLRDLLDEIEALPTIIEAEEGA